MKLRIEEVTHYICARQNCVLRLIEKYFVCMYLYVSAFEECDYIFISIKEVDNLYVQVCVIECL